MPKCALSVIVFCRAVSLRILVGIPKTRHFTCTRGSRQARYQPTTQNSAPRGRVTQARSMTRRGRSTRDSARSGGVRRSLASQPPMGSPPVAMPPLQLTVKPLTRRTLRWWTWTSSSLLSGRRCNLLPATLPPTQRQVLHACSNTSFACGICAWALCRLVHAGFSFFFFLPTGAVPIITCVYLLASAHLQRIHVYV